MPPSPVRCGLVAAMAMLATALAGVGMTFVSLIAFDTGPVARFTVKTPGRGLFVLPGMDLWYTPNAGHSIIAIPSVEFGTKKKNPRSTTPQEPRSMDAAPRSPVSWYVVSVGTGKNLSQFPDIS